MYSCVRAVQAGQLDLMGFVDYAAAQGVAGVELLDIFWTDAEREIAAVKARIAAAGMEVAMYSISNNFIQPEASVRAGELADLKRGVDIALELGTDILRVFSGSAREGVVAILGENLSGMKSAARDRIRADHVGFIFQQFNLVPYLSVVENASLPCRYSRRRLKRACDADGSVEKSAARLLSALGIGEELRSRRTTDLSVGQQQRVAAARALIGRPELVIADEPTSSLDADRRREFINLLLSEAGRADSTVIFVSHDASLATHFDVAIDLGLSNAAPDPSNAA